MKFNQQEQIGVEVGLPSIAPGPGRALREARESLGLSVEEVAGKLHLSLNTVRALEADDYRGLPPAIFVRGYLKNCARLLNLDQQSIVDDYERTSARDGTPEVLDFIAAAPDSEESRFGFVLMSLMLAAFVGLGWWAYRSGRNPMEVPGSAAVLPGQPPAAVPMDPQPGSEPKPSQLTADGVGSHAPTGSGLPPGEPIQQGQTDAVPVAALQGAVPKPAGTQSIVVRFQGESWVSVVDAEGNRLVYELGAKGAEKAIQGKAPFTVVLGRPAEINLEYNGQPYHHGYTDNRSPARFVISP
jgi:cytoskeleton protein RodZ